MSSENDNPFAGLEGEMKLERNRQLASKKIDDAMSINVLGAKAETAFFTSLVMKMERVPEAGCDTAFTNGRAIYYNPNYIAELTVRETLAVLCHEGLHKGLGHHARRGDRDNDTWNIACDLAINPLLRASGLTLPKGALFPGEGAFKDLPQDEDAESYFDLLWKPAPPSKPDESEQQPGGQSGGESGDEGQHDEQQGDGAGGDSDDSQEGDQPGEESEGDPQGGEGQGQGDGQGQGPGQGPGPGQAKDPGGCGGVIDTPDTSPAGIAEAQAQSDMDLAEAETVAKMMGTLPASMERLIAHILRKTLDWRAILRAFITRRVRRDPTWSRPNRRLICRGIYLPGRGGQKIDEIVLAIDTSGSIGPEQLSVFASEVETILSEIPSSKLTVLWCDCRIQHVQEWRPTDGPLILEPRGGGGTSHRPVFDWIDDSGIMTPIVICFTDLYTSFPEQAPDYPVLWAVYQGPDAPTVPFGILVKIEQDMK